MQKLLLSLCLSALTFSAFAKTDVSDSTAEVLVESHQVAPPLAERIEATLKEAIANTRLPIPLVLAIMKIESGFNPDAQNKSGATGIMQVMPGIHLERVRDIIEKPSLTRREAKEELLDLGVNVEAGVSILSECFNRHRGDAAMAAQCYNGYTTPGVELYKAKVMRAYREFTRSLQVKG